MKLKLLSLIALLGVSAVSNAAVTFNFSTHTGTANGPNGLPIVSAAGAAVQSSSLFASIGYFSSAPNFSDLPGLLSKFVPLDASPLTGITAPTLRNGLINGADYNSAGNVYPGGFLGQTAYILIGNSATILESSSIALIAGIDFGNAGATTFLAPDGLGNRVQSFQLNSSSTNQVLVGNVVPVTTQPVTGNSFVNGISLVPVAVPEPSTALLGLLGIAGLIRRRR